MSEPVYYVDGIPCIFDSIHGDTAKVRIISKLDFTTTPAYLFKYRGYVAHGATLREAMESAKQKWYQDLSPEDIKPLIKEAFDKAGGSLTVKELSSWHHRITGSCQFGRDQFQKEHNLSDDQRLTAKEFVDLVKGDYGGAEVVRVLS